MRPQVLIAMILVGLGCMHGAGAESTREGESLDGTGPLPRGVSLDVSVGPKANEPTLQVAFELLVAHPSGSPLVRYEIVYPEVGLASSAPLDLDSAGRKMYRLVPKEGLTWGDVSSVTPPAKALNIIRIEGAGEERTWGLMR